VKLFQAIALNNHWINDTTSQQLLEFTDNVPWTTEDLDAPLLKTICKKYKIKGVRNKPINSGMISVVFKGYIGKKSKKVAIKMLRKNIHNKLIASIKMIETIIDVLSLFIIDRYKIKDIIEKNITTILSQTNFTKEVENCVKMKNNCIHLPYVKIPKVYEMVTKDYNNVIVMEFIYGLKINEVLSNDTLSGIDRIAFAKQIIKYGVVTSAIHGFTHGDLHSGNILFIKRHLDNKVNYILGIVDFGITYEFKQHFQTMLLEIVTEIFCSLPEKSADKLLRSGLIEPTNMHELLSRDDYENILRFVTSIVNDCIHNDELQLYSFLHKITQYFTSDYITRLGIKPSDDFIKLQLVLAMGQGVTLKLCKDNFMVYANEVINEIFIC
jgi:predicted unusual protein kinase regulating ubiquinone biosynthesis (AarF/ABC1/UbiB family)